MMNNKLTKRIMTGALALMLTLGVSVIIATTTYAETTQEVQNVEVVVVLSTGTGGPGVLP